MSWRTLAAMVSHSDAERLSLALAAANLGDWIWDINTDVVTFSERAAEIFGVPPGPQLTGTDLKSLLHPDDVARTQAAVEHAVKTRSDYNIEYRLVNGRERWVLARGRGLYDGDNVTGMIGVVQEATEQVQTRERLRQEAESLDTINRVGKLLSGELDLHKLVQSVTDAATELSGAEFGAFFYNVLDDAGASYMLYTLSGVPAEKFSQFPMPRATALFGPTFRGEGVIRIDDVRKDSRFGHSAPYHGMPQGHLPVVSYLAVPVVGRTGEVLGGLFFGHSSPGVFDARAEQIVTGLAGQAGIAVDNARLFDSAQRARQAAEQSELRLREEDRRKDEFLAMLAHELRNPLAPIRTGLHLLRSSDDVSTARDVRNMMERQVGHIVRLVDDLLDVSRITSGKIHLQPSTASLHDLVRSAIETNQPAIDAAGVALDVVIPEHLPLIRVDATRMVQVISNVLNNAVKFSKEHGRISCEARVHTAADGSQAEIIISDTGAGIATAFLPRVFDLFVQGDDTGTHRNNGGLGIGLALARKLVEMHGGTIEASSPGEGLGSAFTIRIPVETAASEAIPRAAQPPVQTQKRVLVVDDNEDSCEMLALLIRHMGGDVRTVTDGESAVQEAARYAPDIILLDIGLPGIDGYETCRRIRQQLGANVTIAALTGWGQEEDKKRARNAGFDAHLTKPADPQSLEALLTGVSLSSQSH